LSVEKKNPNKSEKILEGRSDPSDRLLYIKYFDPIGPWHAKREIPPEAIPTFTCLCCRCTVGVGVSSQVARHKGKIYLPDFFRICLDFFISILKTVQPPGFLQSTATSLPTELSPRYIDGDAESSSSSCHQNHALTSSRPVDVSIAMDCKRAASSDGKISKVTLIYQPYIRISKVTLIYEPYIRITVPNVLSCIYNQRA
jgi:hypothetical protein